MAGDEAPQMTMAENTTTNVTDAQLGDPIPVVEDVDMEGADTESTDQTLSIDDTSNNQPAAVDMAGSESQDIPATGL